jgi:sensor c-di-GMP phosphodiesterase-like protein
MVRFVGLLISQTHQHVIRALFFIAVFVPLLSVTLAFVVAQVQGNIRSEAVTQLEAMRSVIAKVGDVGIRLRREATSEPCSPEFNLELRRIAYEPDGLNEFLFISGQSVLCSVGTLRYTTPIALGAPDIDKPGSGLPILWLDRTLDSFGLEGMYGTLAQVGEFAIVVPPGGMGASPRWMTTELGFLIDGKWWHRGGESGLFEAEAHGSKIGSPALPDAFRLLQCDETGVTCVVAGARLGDLLAIGWLVLVGIAVAIVAISLWLSGLAHGVMRRFFAFEARFLRNFSAESVICTYQPILNLGTGEIDGCEVLVRWRDLDDRVVFPDQFLPIVEARGLTMPLTRYVAEKAFAELAQYVPAGRGLQVNINISPRDIDADKLLPLFTSLHLDPRFKLAVEIVETESFDTFAAQRAVDQLRQHGIATYIDDFGTGFSSIHTLGALKIDGVKLDRAFAMASDSSLLGQMLPNALHMVHQTGRVTVVEGVETVERLAELRACGNVDRVQGYVIARPMPIERFVAFLAEQDAGLVEARQVA